MAKHSFLTRVAYPEVKFQVRDLVRVMGIIDPLPNWGGGQYLYKIRFIELQGVNGHRRHVPGAPSSGTTRESHAKFSEGTLWGLKKGPVDTGHRWSVFGEHSIHRETHGIRLGVDLWLNVVLTPGGTECEL